jgi:hypothetical protein
MLTLTDRDRRTIRIAVVGLILYLGLFYGVRGWNRLETGRTHYQQLLVQANDARIELDRHVNHRLRLQKLRDSSRIDLANLPTVTLVAEASAAIQDTARSSGIGISSMRESPGSRTGAELATIHIEAAGPLPGVVTLLDRLGTTGFPLLIDSIQIDPEPRGPGMQKLTLRIVILDYHQWQTTENRRHA